MCCAARRLHGPLATLVRALRQLVVARLRLRVLPAVVANSARIGAKMVVMAMKQKSALVEALMGSCCSHVVHRCPVPVVVVRNLPAPESS